MILIPYIICFFCFLLYSYFLIDPNITFFSNSIWAAFREIVVYWGYYRRDVSWGIYLVLIITFFVLHTIATKKYKKFPLLKYVVTAAILLLFSYPFLSHDFFNYMFDARILTHYGKNPYLFKALDFPADQWTRFMHWTHRTYPYGPIFLPITLIPSFFGLGKFTATFVFFKAVWVSFFLMCVFLLNKIEKKAAVFFATHPLIIVEGLVNGHNDFIALAFGIIGIWFLVQKRNILGRFLLLISAGIKYITIPIILLRVKIKKTYETKLFFLLQIGLIVYLCFTMEIQSWYFLSLFVFIFFFPTFLNRLSILFFGLLLSYYPFIRFGSWDLVNKVNLKHAIIIVFACINIVVLTFFYLFPKKAFFKR